MGDMQKGKAGKGKGGQSKGKPSKPLKSLKALGNSPKPGLNLGRLAQINFWELAKHCPDGIAKSVHPIIIWFRVWGFGEASESFFTAPLCRTPSRIPPKSEWEFLKISCTESSQIQNPKP